MISLEFYELKPIEIPLSRTGLRLKFRIVLAF